MKKMLMSSTILLLTGSLYAQPPRPLSPEARWRHDSTCIRHDLSLSTETLLLLQPAFQDFYRSLDRLLEQNSGQPPARASVETLVKDRDARILPLLNRAEADDFLRMEHRLMPPPPHHGEAPPPASR